MYMSVFYRKYTINFFLCLIYIASNAQITIPWSSSLNVNFGRGSSNPGPALTVGKSDFMYTTNLCPSVGYYTVVSKINCGYINNLSSFQFPIKHYLLCQNRSCSTQG